MMMNDHPLRGEEHIVNDISSIQTLLTQLLMRRTEAATEESRTMPDSPKTFEELKAEIRRRAEEVFRKAEEEVAALEQAEELLKKYGWQVSPPAGNEVQAAANPLVEGTAAEKTGSAYTRHEKPWTETILEILSSDAATNGLTHAELKGELAKTHLAERLAETNTGFYGAIAKLKDRRKIAIYRGRLFTPQSLRAFERNVQLGQAEDLRGVALQGPSSPAKEAILEFLTRRRSATCAQIMAMLKANPNTRNRVEDNKSSVYNLLWRLEKGGRLMRQDGRYSLAAEKNEASTGEPGDASINGRGDTLPIESYESGGRRTLDS